jgi:hypothetical protein
MTEPLREPADDYRLRRTTPGVTVISRFLTLGRVPELRLEAQNPDEERPVPEIEVALDIEDYWELTQLLAQFRYAMESGQATRATWRKIRRIILASIVTERDRAWFVKQAS